MHHASRCKCLSVKHAKYFKLLRIIPDRGASTFINAEEGSIRSKWHDSYLRLASFNFLDISLRIFVRNEKKSIFQPLDSFGTDTHLRLQYFGEI